MYRTLLAVTIVLSLLSLLNAQLGVAYSRDGSVSYHGKNLGTLEYKVPGSAFIFDSQVLIAGPSPIRGFLYIVLFDEHHGGIKAYIANGKSRAILSDDIIKEFPWSGHTVESRVGPDISWSPDEVYAVTPDIGEVQHHVNIIDLRSGKSARVNIGDLSQGECEIQSISMEGSRWLGARDFVFTVQIWTNPWSDVKCPANVKHPSYEAIIDVNTKQIKFQKREP
jgi:hypothetical protein